MLRNGLDRFPDSTCDILLFVRTFNNYFGIQYSEGNSYSSSVMEITKNHTA